MKGRLETALLIMLWWASLSSADLGAEPFGSSGGLKNEGDIPVKVTIVRAGGVNESLILERGGLYDLPEDAQRVTISQSALDPPDARARLRVEVTDDRGARHVLSRFGDSAEVKGSPRGVFSGSAKGLGTTQDKLF
ncbi:MAG: hypothetical protein FGM27_07235 [Candidatus Omnitrophica bacterium]|nr:hypothetical protein [Candidatus Omnitrophota bacterium]